MARTVRIQFPGAIYHVRTIGNSKQAVFLCDGDRWAFLRMLGSVVERYQWLCHGYCLMNNHYHLMIETPRGNLSSGMKVLNGAYTQATNRRHGRTGHIFEGRFRSKVLEKEGHLVELCRYIALNPVKAGVVDDPAEWRWSSFRAMSGSQQAPPFLTTELVLSYFAGLEKNPRESFAEFVREGLAPGAAGADIPEYLRIEEESEYDLERPPLSEIIDPAADRSERKAQIAVAVLTYRYSTIEVAAFLGIARSNVSRAIKSLQELQRRSL
jgi:REP-associated tyrosine transposase